MAPMAGCTARVKGPSDVRPCAQCRTVEGNCQNRENTGRHAAIFFFFSLLGIAKTTPAIAGCFGSFFFSFFLNFLHWQERRKNDFNDSSWTVTASAVGCFLWTSELVSNKKQLLDLIKSLVDGWIIADRSIKNVYSIKKRKWEDCCLTSAQFCKWENVNVIGQ